MQFELDASRVQRLRLSRGLTQAELASQMNVPTATLSRVLSGHLRLGQDEISALSTALGCKPQVLSAPVGESLYTRPWLRAYADAPKKTVEQFVADTLLAIEAVGILRLKRLPERLPTFHGDANDEHEIDDFAASVRDSADVTTAHVPNVTRAAERLGCIVLPMNNELGKHMGMSMFVDGTPVIRAARPSAHIPGDRQRFTVAHELGHLTMHQSAAPPDSAETARVVERQAHRFAAAFLLPADYFLEDLDEVGGRVTLATLSKLKERWGVAIKAMVVRLQQLHRIDSDHARSLYKQISARGWNKSEPVEVQNERALWLSQALSRRFGDDEPIAQATSHTGLSATYFEDWADWSFQTEATVLRFPVRR
jgi:Zn-dependent peptidase ImmA (M78 family)/transcriptional regulator with XRE-family HTH domain